MNEPFSESPSNPLIVSGAMNAALEAHQTALRSGLPTHQRQCAKIRRSCGSTSGT